MHTENERRGESGRACGVIKNAHTLNMDAINVQIAMDQSRQTGREIQGEIEREREGGR